MFIFRFCPRGVLFCSPEHANFNLINSRRRETGTEKCGKHNASINRHNGLTEESGFIFISVVFILLSSTNTHLSPYYTVALHWLLSEHRAVKKQCLSLRCIQCIWEVEEYRISVCVAYIHGWKWGLLTYTGVKNTEHRNLHTAQSTSLSEN